MTQKDKELLLKDLCVRVPYRVKCKYDDRLIVNTLSVDFFWEKIEGYERYVNCTRKYDVENIKPYLFPLSRLNNLTEEQRKTLKVMCDWNDEEADAQSILVLYQKHFVMKTDVIDWLNENHFDYRGLIEKGLAIDATGQNIY
jgi:hypothetical protein